MKEKIIGVLVCMLMVSSVLASVAVSENGRTVLFDIEDGTISVTIPVETYEIENTDEGDMVSVENFGHLLIPGKPNLPSKIFSVAIPPGAEVVEVSFETSESVVLPGFYYICPAPLPRVIGKEDPLIYKQELNQCWGNYNSVYGSDDLYPASIVEFVRTAGYRKYNLVDLRVNPFTYRPISGQLTFYPEITIVISYTFPEDFTYGEIMIDNIEGAEQVAEKIVYNYDQAKEWYPKGIIGGMETYDYVIITLDSLTSSVTSLVDWEEAKGRSVNVVTTSWINSNYNGYDLAEKIRNFLRDKYPSEEWGILDVCIVGHWDDVPIRTCYQYVYGYGPPDTDLYYAELSLPDSQSWDADGDRRWGEDSDPIDFYSEVTVGRIPWSDPSTVEHICDKSVAYEMNNDPSFKKNILLLGAFFWSDTDNAVLMEYKVNSDLHPWMSDWTMTRMYEQAQSSYQCDYDLNYNNVKSVWSSGTYAFVDWAGHGSPTSCHEYYPYPAMPAFVDTDTCPHLNDDYPAIIFADACSNSDTDYLNIGQAMLKEGAVGFLGSTEVAFGMHAWGHPNHGSSQSLDYYFTTCVTSGDYTQGQAHQWALLEMYTKNLWYYNKYEMFEWGALWGNPDLAMAPIITNNPPDAPEIDGPTEGEVGEEYEYDFVTNDPEEDDVSYYVEWGDDTTTGWTDFVTSGTEVTLTHTWEEQGVYTIKAKAKDVYNAESDWSELDITITNPPEIPSNPSPEDGRLRVIKNPILSWDGGDPDSDDTVKYEIYFGTNEDPPLYDTIGPYPSTQKNIEYKVSEDLERSTWYYWKIKAIDNHGATTEGTVWRFLTKLFWIIPGGSGTCFLAGTHITMADGSYKNIEDIEIDDMVKSYDTTTGVLVDAEVTKVYHHTPEEMADYYVVINGGIRVTPNHLLYINGEFIPAGEAQEGDFLTSGGGEGTQIESVEQVFDQVPTYDFEVSTDGGLTSFSSYVIAFSSESNPNEIEELPVSKPPNFSQEINNFENEYNIQNNEIISEGIQGSLRSSQNDFQQGLK